MAKSRIQIQRSNVSRQRPPAGRDPGELHVNWPDKQLTVLDGAKNPQELLAVRFFSATAAYALDEVVVQAGALYRAPGPIAAGPFNIANWDPIGTIDEAPIDGKLYIRQYGDWVDLTSVDGPASSIDADALDGQQGIFYQNADNLSAGTLPAARFTDVSHGTRGGGTLHAAAGAAAGFMSVADKTKLDGVQAGSTDDQTPAEILAAVITVDGAGSALDADLLDGQQGAFYQNAGNLSTGILPAARFDDTSHGNRGGGSLHPNATTSLAGFMSPADKTKLGTAIADDAPADGKTYGRKDNTWATVVGGATISDTPPGGVKLPGQMWFESDTGNTFIWYDDGNTTQWVQINSGTDSQGQATTAQARNRIVNPAMQISQENGVATGTTNGYYAVDQFIGTFVSTGVFAFTRVPGATPRGSVWRFRVGISTADTSLTTNERLQIRQNIEGIRIADCGWGTAAARQFVLRFGWKSPAGTFSVSLHNSDGTRSYIAVFTIAAGQANIDTEQMLIIPGDVSGSWLADTGIGIQLHWNIAVGPSLIGVAGWQTSSAPGLFGTSANTNGATTAGNLFELFDVGLYLDPQATGVAPPWQTPDEAQELAACQRYWQQAFCMFSGQVATGNGYYGLGSMQVKMRVTPAVSGTNAGNISFPATVGAYSAANANTVYENRTANVTGVGLFDSQVALNSRM